MLQIKLLSEMSKNGTLCFMTHDIRIIFYEQVSERVNKIFKKKLRLENDMPRSRYRQMRENNLQKFAKDVATYSELISLLSTDLASCEGEAQKTSKILTTSVAEQRFPI